MNSIVVSIVRYALSVLILLTVWKLMVFLLTIPPYILPPPEKVLETLIREAELFEGAFVYTISNTLIGGLLGTSAGILLGMVLSYSRRLRWIVEPYLMIFQSFPRESLFPLFLIWVGFGAGPKIINAFLLSFFPVAVITLNAMVNVERPYIKLMRSWYASRFQEFIYCRLPNSVPQLVSSVKVALPMALIGAVLGEFLGGDKGLGYIIISSGAQFRVDRIFAAIVLLALTGISFLAVIQIVQHFLLRRFYY